MGTLAELTALRPRHDSLVGIDSDGCVFDSMTVKQRTCFHRAFLDAWDLGAVEGPVRECLEFVNLFSTTRGQDRFVCLDLAVDLMRERPELRDAVLPQTDHLKRWLEAGPPFGNAGLEAVIAGEKGEELRGSAELQRILRWSLEVDARVRALPPVEPFPHARRFLEKARATSDLMVVSSTPLAALTHEWESNGIRSLVRFICSKDIGTKVQHLRLATAEDRYSLDRVLMIGDAPKDLESARETGVRFFPVDPGREDGSWRRLLEEVYPLFLEGAYDRAREEVLVDEFLALLPADPAWV